VGNCFQGIFLKIWQCEKARKPKLQRSLMLPNALRNKQERIRNFTEFVFESCVSNVRQEAYVIRLCAFLVEVGLFGHNDVIS